MLPALFIYTGFLFVLGAIGYVGTGMEHPTALIPVGFGIVTLICSGIATMSPGARKHAMHAAALVALLGVLAIGSDIARLAAGEGLFVRGFTAFGSKALMALGSLVFLVFCIRSFIAVRKNRHAEANETPAA